MDMETSEASQNKIRNMVKVECDIGSITAVDATIQGAKHITSCWHEDERGIFMESYDSYDMNNLGLRDYFTQDNLTITKKNTLRGLHFQRHIPQGKLIRCVAGSIMDVIVDLRPESPTYLKHETIILHDTRQAFYAPPGVAHGFYSLTDAVVSYKCTENYRKEYDMGINPLDPALGIKWPFLLEGIAPILSEKDFKLPTLKEYLNATTANSGL